MTLALLLASDSWLDALVKGSYVGALLIDLSKAFDTVPHLLLLSEVMNIGYDVVAWFRNYLTNRIQHVITYEEITHWLPVSRGFLQGSSLSPLLFNIYVRKLPEKCISDIFQFTDDTTLVAADPSLEDAIQRCPTLIVLKEDNNNNSAAVGLINAACDIKLCR